VRYEINALHEDVDVESPAFLQLPRSEVLQIDARVLAPEKPYEPLQPADRTSVPPFDIDTASWSREHQKYRVRLHPFESAVNETSDPPQVSPAAIVTTPPRFMREHQIFPLQRSHHHDRIFAFPC
jgi:hypothetical protein